MIESTPEGRVRHFPAKPDLFEFDDEVASVFDDMARRSIPLYGPTHAVVAQLCVVHLRSRKDPKDTPRILDLGCSTGRFFLSLYNTLGALPDDEKRQSMWQLVGVDSSKAMLDLAAENVPYATLLEHDATELLFDAQCDDPLFGPSTYDVVNMSYFVQFLPVAVRQAFYASVYRVLKPGGLLIVSNKDDVDPRYSDSFDNIYMDFRRHHGYSDEEIRAKTRALQDVMATTPYSRTVAQMYDVGFGHVQEVSRYLHFSTVIATKG